MSVTALFLSWLSSFSLLFTNLVFAEVSIYSLKSFIFLENNTKEQKKKIRRMFLAAGIVLLVFDLLSFGSGFGAELLPKDSMAASYLNSIWSLSTLLCVFVPLVIGFIAVAYSSVTARKRAKWLGIFVVLPMDGYTDMPMALIDIPFGMLPLDADSPYYTTYQNFFKTVFYIFFRLFGHNCG